MPSALELQKQITRIALSVASSDGFALAGSGAIREHGLISRPTEDVDMFTTRQFQGQFRKTVAAIVDALVADEFSVEQDVQRQGDTFSRLLISKDGVDVVMDLGIDYRSADPEDSPLGPLTSEQDAVGSKVSALFSRGEDRDFLDVDSIRQSGKYSDEALMEMAAQHDLGFDRRMFADRLDMVERITPDDVARYDVLPQDLYTIQRRLRTWATEIRGCLSSA
jgi:hypothetical protein